MSPYMTYLPREQYDETRDATTRRHGIDATKTTDNDSKNNFRSIQACTYIHLHTFTSLVCTEPSKCHSNFARNFFCLDFFLAFKFFSDFFLDFFFDFFTDIFLDFFPDFFLDFFLDFFSDFSP